MNYYNGVRIGVEIKVTVTEGDTGRIGGGDEKKEERHDGDASHCKGAPKREWDKCLVYKAKWLT